MSTTHTQVVRTVQTAVRERVAAETNHNDDVWHSYRLSHADFVKMLRGIKVYAVGSRKVRASVPDTEAGSLWSYVAFEALDASAQFDDVFETGGIRRISNTTWELTW